jgi:small subunit ribosomal protein S6
LLNEYETTLIFRGDLDEATVQGIVTSLTDVLSQNGAEVLIRDDWGQKKLQYVIQKQARGHYVRLCFLSPASLIGEFERKIRIQDQIVRFLTIRRLEAVDVESRKAWAVEELKTLEEARRKRAEAESMAQADEDSDDDYAG